MAVYAAGADDLDRDDVKPRRLFQMGMVIVAEPHPPSVIQLTGNGQGIGNICLEVGYSFSLESTSQPQTSPL